MPSTTPCFSTWHFPVSHFNLIMSQSQLYDFPRLYGSQHTCNKYCTVLRTSGADEERYAPSVVRTTKTRVFNAAFIGVADQIRRYRSQLLVAFANCIINLEKVSVGCVYDA
eukprot:IDg3974t1